MSNGMEINLFEKTLAFPYEKGQTIEAFCEPLILGGEHYFST